MPCAFRIRAAHGEPTSFIIGEPKAPTQLTPEDSVFFDQMGQGLLLPMIQPADQRGEKKPRGRDVNPCRSLHHRPRFGPESGRPSRGTLRASAEPEFPRDAGAEPESGFARWFTREASVPVQSRTGHSLGAPEPSARRLLSVISTCSAP